MVMNETIEMINVRKLPEEKIYTGEGQIGNEAIRLTQIKRTDDVAMYKRENAKHGYFQGYEVFIVKTSPAGIHPQSGKWVEAMESYPGAKRFGNTAWHCQSREDAEQMYNEAIQKVANQVENVPDENGVRRRGKKAISLDTENILIPEGEFTRKQLQEINNYKVGMFVKALAFLIESGKIQEVDRRSFGKGKPTIIYTKA